MDTINTIYITPDDDQKEEAYYQDLRNSISDLRQEQLLKLSLSEEKRYDLVKDDRKQDLNC